ncbi:multifunctional CCA addition/repair protein [Salinisphaera sp. Q1T1-3]|uniref:multifunctional CCA addition/repair protein n=1 Tax=Salinisphaera sp. Q1T1-3 TaxID=2321229 RepID=UPI000E74A0ED|nr:multifunctional CCA addition/repair protein [Salinisphaera sp. Q1T1-3]RJS91264.1 multifunctional CCA addition/repair protein [Salinisphaera sp. Q1T1-3]
MTRYLVGGAVRDALLGLPVADRDWVVVGSTPRAMTEAGYTPVGRDFPVFLHPETAEEHALARTERKSGHGYHGFVFHAGADVSLMDDLARRDLTINAIARDDDGTLHDPYHGQRDLERRVLRHVSPAFVEDPVRILRLARYYARFARLGFHVAEPTRQLCCDMVASGEIDHLVPERVWAEAEKALMGDEPATFFYFLREIGALARLFPELDALFGVPQPTHYHPEVDCGVHTLLVLDRAAAAGAGLPARYGALCHDYGKALTPARILPGHHGHEERGVAPAEAASQRLGVPKKLRDSAPLIARWHTHVHRIAELRPATVLSLLEGIDALRRPERLDDLVAVCAADVRGRLGYEGRTYPQAEQVRRAHAAALSISGRDIARDRALSGPEIGKALRQARIRAIGDALSATPAPY